MGTAPTQCPPGISANLHAKFDNRIEFSCSNFPSTLNISKLNCHPNSKGLVNRICSLPDIDDLFWEKVPTPILDVVENPMHLKNLTIKELKLLADEIRSELSSIMSRTQRSFKASLAAVELTVALHYVFHAPVDKILWDAGEQVTSYFMHFSSMPLFAYVSIRMPLHLSLLMSKC